MACNLIVATLSLLFVSLIAIHVRLPTPLSPPVATSAPVVSSSNSTATPVVSPPLSDLTPAIIPSEYSGPSLPPDFYEDELYNIFQALLAQNDFTIWGKLLAGHSTKPVLPDQATLFVPLNAAVLDLRDRIDIDRNLIPYHIIPQRLSFDQLRAFEPLSTLPILLPSKTLQITATPLNFTIQHTFITHPDIYLSSVFAVHGVEHLFPVPL
ncbi:FAS1 domain-containing protein [Heracleum sosnowskyi]|uniref:FAS1 domain-containing protein n=1 Tax=Heracleum sosnowskyi TaxID=360622 RepID=A0AAD8GR06_9APIA|nr:FAS1 domain-containing protein [Heracleum sosnowskyi]